MNSPNSESTTNLLLAAYLIVGGATLVSLETEGRFTRVFLDLTTLSRKSLVGHANQLASRTEISLDTMRSWEEVFDYSFLSRVDHEYQSLKRRINARRSNPVHA